MTRERAHTENRPRTRIHRAQNGKTRASHTVSFRLEEECLSKLEHIGSKRGNSIHEQAREMLMALLIGDETELLAMRMTLDAINEKFDQYTTGMADTLEAILIMNGVTEEKAKAFIDERLRVRGKRQ
jgi:hypothetical protein